MAATEFAYRSSQMDSVGNKLFFLDLGHPRQTLVTLSVKRATNVRSVSEHQNILNVIYRNEKETYPQVQKLQTNWKRQGFEEPNYKIGDKVLVDRKVLLYPYSSIQEHCKLQARYLGPFKIIELIGRNAIRCDLPHHLQAHRVDNVPHTRVYVDQDTDFSSQVMPEPVIVELPTGPEQFLESILRPRWQRNRIQFIVKWKEKPTHEVSWEPLKNLMDGKGTVNTQLPEYIRTRADLNVECVIPSRGQ